MERKQNMKEKVVEKCSNPFIKGICGRTDIELYIYYKSGQQPICSKCWRELSEGKLQDVEWGYDKWG